MELGDLSAIQQELDEDSFLSRRLLGPEPPSNPGSRDVVIDIPKGSLEGITSRKGVGLRPGEGDPPETYDVDENKYEKHPIDQLWKNFTSYISRSPSSPGHAVVTRLTFITYSEPKKAGSLTPASSAIPKKAPRRMRITMRKLLFLFAILSTLMTVVMLHYSLSSSPEV